MKENLKIFIARFLLTAILYNFCFSFLLFELSITLNRNSIEKILSDADESRLEVLKVMDDNSIIRKDNHEIIFEGKTYDVKKEVHKSGIIYFYCYRDAAEEDLFTAYNSIVKSNSDTQDEKQSNRVFNVLKIFEKVYLKDYSLIEYIDRNSLSKFIIENDAFQSHHYFTITTPPPEKFFTC